MNEQKEKLLSEIPFIFINAHMNEVENCFVFHIRPIVSENVLKRLEMKKRALS